MIFGSYNLYLWEIFLTGDSFSLMFDFSQGHMIKDNFLSYTFYRSTKFGKHIKAS